MLTRTLKRSDKYYMDLVMQIREGSKCHRAQYGSLIVAADGKRIVATGFNGKPAGAICDGVCFRVGLPPNAVAGPCCLHSERNCLMFSHPLERQGGTMFVSGIPCEECALHIMQSGLARLVYFDGAAVSGHTGNSNDAFWERYGVPIVRVPYTLAAWEALYG